MAHKHSVYDTDLHFKIDPITRTILNQATTKTKIIQGDHNSERFTFEIPRFVDGHDMMLCDKIEVHYINIVANNTDKSEDVYLVEDMQISPEDENIVIFSWLISGNATVYPGSLNFIIKFKCLTGDTIDYQWQTEIYNKITISLGMNNGEVVITNNSDTLEAWRIELFEAGGDAVVNVNTAKDEALSAIWYERANVLREIDGVMESIPEDYTELDADVTALKKTTEDNSSLISRDSKRITTLESAVYGDLAQEVEDNSVAYVKDVPANALPYAKITEIGGMTRECTNLVPLPYARNGGTISGIVWAVNPDGTVTANGTATETSIFALRKYDICLKKGTYTVSGIPANGSTSTFMIQCASKIHGAAINNISVDGNKVVLDNDITDYLMQCVIFAGYTANNLVFKPMINEGSTALPYEPYFEGLRSAPVTEVKSVGANLLPYPYDNTTRTQNGVTFTDNGDGSITINGTPTEDTGFMFRSAANPIVLDAGSYRFGLNADKATNAYAYASTVLGAAVVSTAVQATNIKERTNTTYVSLIAKGGTTYENVTIKPMLYKGSTELTYTPYKQLITAIPIPEAVQALDGYGEGVNANYYNYIDFEKKQFVKCVGRCVVDGVKITAHGINEHNNGVFYATIRLPKYGINGDDALKVTNFLEDAHVEPGNAYMTGNGGTFVLVNPDQSIRTIEEWSAWLKENPVEVVYALAEPIITDISDLLPADGYIEVEGGGSLTFANEHKYDVPSNVVFVTKG